MDIAHAKHELKEFLSRSFKIHSIKDTDDIFDTGIVHSLFFIQLLVFIEKKFKIELVEGEFNISKLRSIDEIANLISSKVS
jgi:D-alanine--poly(phosphoribitol) ligase subunit 2